MRLRPATIADCDLLFRWANDPETRSMSLSSKPIELSEHKEWLRSLLANEKRLLYIAVQEGEEVGTCRADFDMNSYYLSWQVFPAYRNQGYGKQMVRQLLAKHTPCHAKIKVDNISSIKIAESLGMKLEKQEGEILIYKSDDK